MTSDQKRPTYTPEQISAYFDRLKLPEQHRKYDVAGMEPEAALAYLSQLQRLHLVAIPFENLTLHYSPHRQICIHPEDLFKKIIGDNNGRGGYCMENNGLFGTLLYSIGFVIYSAGGRVFENGRWTGWAHRVNIITIAETKYHVDVGFGSNSPVIPMVLDKSGPIQPHIAPASARLQWRNISGNTDPSQRLWVYEHCINASSDFQVTYCFTELEFLPSDYSLMNYFTSTNARTIFTQMIVCEKKIPSEDGESLVGTLILGNKGLKWRINGEKKKEVAFENEEDRVRAIEKHFGIKLSQVERDSIHGLPTALS